MPVWLVPKKIKKHGLKEHGQPSQITQIWIEFLFEHYNKLKNQRDKFPELYL